MAIIQTLSGDMDQRIRAMEAFLLTADYQDALKSIRNLLRHHLVRVLGGDWERIHNEYGMYTINCRAKSTRRTLEKARRLNESGRDVDVTNFFNHMPDLVAGRLVVVDADDLLSLAERVRCGCISPLFEQVAPPHKPYRVRHGKFSMYNTGLFERAGYEIEVEPTGYCSVHFVFRPGKDFFVACREEETGALARLHACGAIPISSWHVEVQVRTIMDEAWGETDHFVRYSDPGLRDDPELQSQFSALAAYLQAANHHVSVIRNTARRKALKKHAD